MKRKFRSILALASAASVAALAIASPADAAETTSNDDASATIFSGPTIVVKGYQPKYTVSVTTFKNHKIKEAVMSKDCDFSFGTFEANKTTSFDCTMDAPVSYPGNDYFDVRISGTGHTWPYLGSGHTSTLDLSRKLTVIDPQLSVTVSSATGSSYFNGEDPAAYIGLTAKATVKNTGDVALKGITLNAGIWVCSVPASTLAVGASSTATCTTTIYGPTTSSIGFSANATGYPNVDTSKLYPADASASGSGSMTFRDDLDLTVVTTPGSIRP